MKLNYFILVSKDNEVSHAITKEFVDTHNIENIMEQFMEARSFDLDIDGFDVMLEMFEVESQFMEIIQKLGGIPGIIWLQNAEVNALLWEEIKDVVDPAEIVKGDNYQYTPLDDDVIEYIGESAEGVVIGIQDTSMYDAEVQDFLENEESVC